MIVSEGILGRDRELEVVATLVSNATTGGGALLVRGDAGIGKSALLERAVMLAQTAGMRVLFATGVRTEANLPSRDRDLPRGAVARADPDRLDPARGHAG